MARTIVVANQKGGVGKTTTVANLGAALAEIGQRVLLVDLDPRGDLSVHFGVTTEESGATVYEALFEEGIGLEEVIVRVEAVGVEVALADINLAGAEWILVDMAPGERQQVVAEALDPVGNSYDFILIDTGPGLHLLSLSALAAADEVIIPQECSYLAVQGLRQITDNIKQMQEIKPGLKICGILLTMHDRRTIHHQQVIEMVRAAFGELVFNTVIPRTVKFQESPVSGQPITKYAASSEAAEVYRNIAKEVIERG